VRYVPGKGTENYQVGAMHFLAKASLTDPALQDVDFSYCEVSGTLQPYRQEIVSSDVVSAEVPITGITQLLRTRLCARPPMDFVE
jgi:hypothetical protein